jgi:hypothetical protein
MKTNINTWTTLKAFTAAAKTAGVDTTVSDRAVKRAEAMTVSSPGQDNDIVGDIKKIFKQLK